MITKMYVKREVVVRLLVISISEVQDTLSEIGIADMTTENLQLYPAIHLFDGNYNNFCHSDSPEHSDGFIVTLNLKLVTRITRIKVFNRVDCCQDRMMGFTVYIIKHTSEGEVSCGEIDEVKLVYEFHCEGVGYKVELRKDGLVNIVNLAEVEIYGQPGRL